MIVSPGGWAAAVVGAVASCSPISSTMIKGSDRRGDFVLLGFGEVGVDGKADHFPGGGLAVGERAGPDVEMGEAGLEVKGDGIIDAVADAAGLEMIAQGIAAVTADRVLVEDVVLVGGGGGQAD